MAKSTSGLPDICIDIILSLFSFIMAFMSAWARAAGANSATDRAQAARVSDALRRFAVMGSFLVVGAGGQAIAAILRHSSAQELQARAHSWQCAILCLAHSSAQAWQTSAQAVQTVLALSLARAITAAARAQICAQ